MGKRGVYRGTIPGCPAKAELGCPRITHRGASMSRRVQGPHSAQASVGRQPRAGRLGFLLARARAVLVLFLLDRHRIDAAEPAIEVDVGAAPAAERTELLRRGLAADRAGSRCDDIGALGHAIHVVTGWATGKAHTALSQPKRIG